ncbi:MAG: TIGR03546 family protein [Gemmatimonadota bacterium]|nr:TIGR03546 family protein [Gemmatimonadota bacterium]
MLTLLKIVQSLFKALNSEGTPGQVAAGIAVGSALGLTPLVSLHNLIIVAAIALLNISVPGAIVGWLVAVPFGFLLDPVFHLIGRWLLVEVLPLVPVWTTVYNTPVLSLANFNNTVVLGSLVGWIVLWIPIYLVGRMAVRRYRKTVYPKLAKSRLFKAVQASKLYNLYRLFQP